MAEENTDDYIDLETDIKTTIQQIEFEREQEEDEAEASNLQYEINSYGGDFDVDGLVRRFERGDIYWPEFQRNYVWTKKQASRFIESILIGLPIPSLFLYKEEQENRLFIVDGLQRITTLHAFKHNKFPTKSGTKSTKFGLNGLPKDSQFYNKTYEQLEAKDRRTFDDTIIHIQFIEQTAPDNDHSAAFNIFERLNSGGTPLQAQEMRNALYLGSFQKHLSELNKTKIWREIFDGPPHKRGKDIELILRFLALYNWEKNYKNPMKIFLNRFMKRYRNADEDQLNQFCSQFSDTLGRIYEALGNDAFKVGRYRSFSASYYDAFMVAVAGNKNATPEKIKAAYIKLQNFPHFLELSRSGTTNTNAVKRRIKMVREVLDAAK